MVPKIDKGLHDFLTIAWKNPNKEVKDKEYINSAKFLLLKRTPIIVGDKQEPSIPQFIESDNMSSEIINSMFISNNPSTTIRDYKTLVNSNDSFWLNIPISNSGEELAIFSILNNKQINLIYPYQKSLSKGTLHIPVKLPENAKGNFFIGAVETPYIKLQKPFDNMIIGVESTNLITIK